jgi:hypothetical protein
VEPEKTLKEKEQKKFKSNKSALDSSIEVARKFSTDDIKKIFELANIEYTED